MKKNNKILRLMLSLIMAMSLVPTMALAASVENCPGSCTHVAAIGTTHYDTLQEAVDDARNGNTITLVGDKDIDVEEMITIPAGKEITIDLNGREIYVYDDIADENLYGITNHGKLTLTDSSTEKDGQAWMIDNYGELIVDNGEIYILTNNEGAQVVINDGKFSFLEGDGSYSVNGGMFLRFPPLGYVDENDVVVEVDIYVKLSQSLSSCVYYSAVNDSIEVYESDMKYVDHAEEGYANFNIVYAPNGAELNIDNLHPDLLINNKTNSEVILNGHLVGAGVSGKKLADLPVYGANVEVPETGDDSTPLLYGALMLLALAGIVGTTVISKREKA